MAAEKKQATKKTTARKRTAVKDADNERSAKQSARSAPKASSSRKPRPLVLARNAAEQLADLTGRESESTTGIERTDDGWRIELEVVETRRIPDSADILALYEVQVDPDGELISYRRLRRYPRGRTDPVDGVGR